MAVRARTVFLGLAGLALVVVLIGITMVGWQIVLGPRARAVTDRKFTVTSERIDRGRYLVEQVAACFHCHSDHDLTSPEYPIIAEKKGAGWAMPVPDLGSLVAPNITPDLETGIGAWKDDEVLRAIQEGVSRDGRALFPIMPWMNYANLTPDDAESIVVYLRTISAVKQAQPTSQLIFPLSLLVNTFPRPIASHAPAPPRTTPEGRGEYLVRHVAGCQNCHTPIDERGVPRPDLEFGGGGLFHDPGDGMKQVFSLNITRDPSGIAHYDEGLFLQVMQTGQVTSRFVSHIMPFEAFRGMTEDDLKDVWAYLQTLTPVKHRVSNSDPPKPCPVCGQRHGLGELNVRRPE